MKPRKIYKRYSNLNLAKSINSIVRRQNKTNNIHVNSKKIYFILKRILRKAYKLLNFKKEIKILKAKRAQMKMKKWVKYLWEAKPTNKKLLGIRCTISEQSLLQP